MVGVAAVAVRYLGLGTAALSVAGLVATGLVAWRRTAGLRSSVHGRVRPTGRRPGAGPSSRTTWIAAGGGMGLALAGLATILGGARDGVLGPAMALAGGLVFVSGLRDRVVELVVDDRGLLVVRAGRPATRLAWSEIVALRPPRTPLGGWRVLAGKGSATLMPSDVLGREWVLGEVVVRAPLVRDGRAWAAPTP
jgi:hypothetical protein